MHRKDTRGRCLQVSIVAEQQRRDHGIDKNSSGMQMLARSVLEIRKQGHSADMLDASNDARHLGAHGEGHGICVLYATVHQRQHYATVLRGGTLRR
jgi:hypothetical protein